MQLAGHSQYFCAVSSQAALSAGAAWHNPFAHASSRVQKDAVVPPQLCPTVCAAKVAHLLAEVHPMSCSQSQMRPLAGSQGALTVRGMVTHLPL